MRQQHRILETISSPEGLARLSALIASESFPHRTALANRVCTEFGFVDARGRPQLATCLKALRTLHDRGSIQLPPPVTRGGHGTPRRLGHPVPPPRSVPSRVNEVRGLQLQLVRSDAQRRTWNELIDREHPRGAACHVGAQLRYLLLSEHGILGALGFAAAALALADRDRFIGWSPALRQRQLYRIANLSRFLIRPAVRCRNLASKALALCARRLPADFRDRYRYAPWLLETFVERDRYRGTCFKAANWIPVGRTAGRGRHAPNDARVPVKSILLYPLRPDWRALLGVPPPPRPWTGLDQPGWASQEFGDAPLGDARLSRRLVICAALSASAPGAPFPSVTDSSPALAKGYYRLLDKPPDSPVTPANILAPHRARTLRRMRAERTVLCIQDGSDLNFAERPGCVGLGLIGKNRGSKGTPGLHMHSTLAVNGRGVPLGVPLIQFDAPDSTPEKDKPPARRKTQRWVRGLRDCARIAEWLDGTRPVSVMDREADFFELFDACRELGTVDLLVRAKHNRRLAPRAPKLFDGLRKAPAQARRKAAPEAHRGRDAALAEPAPAAPGQGPLEGAPAGEYERGACVGRGRPGRGGAAGMVPADQPGDYGGARGGPHAGVVPAALAHRGLAPRAQVGLPGPRSRQPAARAAAAGGDDQGGDRLAADGDDPAGARHAGAATRHAVRGHGDQGAGGLRPRPRAAAAGQPRAGRADHGPAGRLPQPQARRSAGPQAHLGRLHALGNHRAGLRAHHPSGQNQYII